MYRVEGIIVGAKNWGEADRIIDVFSREHGLIKATAFGCRRMRSPLAGSLQLFSHVDLQLVKGKRIDTIRHASRINSFRWLSEDLTIMAYATFVAEIVREFFPEGESNEEFFTKLTMIMLAFKDRNPRVTALMAAVHLLEIVGLQLNYASCLHCGVNMNNEGYLAISEGGAICTECYQAVADKPMVFSYPVELKNFLIQLKEYDWTNNNVIIVKGNILMQAEKIVLGHIMALVENPLQSLKFINQLS